jgi:hypothetical protein
MLRPCCSPIVQRSPGIAYTLKTEVSMKKLLLALAATAALGTAASAQGVQIGPGGVRVDPGGDRYERRDYDRGERRWREGRRGGGDCRTIIVKKEDQFGRRITKRIERCD